MADPDEIQRTVAKMQDAIRPAVRLQSQAGFADLAAKIQRVYSPVVADEFAKVTRIQGDAARLAAAAIGREQFRQVAEQAARAFSRSDLAQISDQIGRAYSPGAIHTMARFAADSIRVADFAVAFPADVDVGVAVSRFEAELTADDAPHFDRP
jgi:hypothetical protein